MAGGGTDDDGRGQAKDMMMWWWDGDAKVIVSSGERPNLVVLAVLFWVMVCNGGMGQPMAWVEEG